MFQLVETLKQLRGLLAKSYLRKDDIQFVLSLCGSHGDEYTLSPVLGKVLLAFVVHLDGDKEITELVLEQVHNIIGICYSIK